MRFLSSIAGGVFTAATLLAASPATQAESQFPSRPVTLVVPFSPGGGPDHYCRKFAQKFEKLIGQTVIVENRPGAQSTIGSNHVAKAKPDGYTILYATSSSVAAAPSMFKDLPYDPEKDFRGVATISQSYQVLLVNNEHKDLKLDQIAEQMKADPGRFPVAGGSTTQEVINGLFQKAAQTETSYVRYASASQMMTDLLGGRLGIAITPISQAMPFMTGGRAHAVAVSSPERLPSIKDVPTISETFSGVHQDTWTAFFVPANTPDDVVQYLHDAINKVQDDPEMVQLAEESGKQFRMTPQETDAFVKDEIKRWSEILKIAGVSAV